MEDRGEVHEHRRSANGYINTDPGVPSDRAYEKTLYARIIVLTQRFGPLMSGFILVMLMFGFDFKTPAKWFESIETKLEAQQAEINDVRARVEEERRSRQMATDSMMMRLDVLVRFRCNELTGEQRDLYPLCDRNLR